MRSGVIRCDSIKEQFDFALALAHQPLPAGPNVAVIANAGGPGIMATDAIERNRSHSLEQHAGLLRDNIALCEQELKQLSSPLH